jgi:hypothetical protein
MEYSSVIYPFKKVLIAASGDPLKPHLDQEARFNAR